MNHGFVSAKVNIDPERVDEVIRRVAKTIFKGVLAVKRTDNDGPSWWVGHEDYRGVVVWFESKRKLVFRRGNTHDFTGWIQAVLQSEIGKAFKGGRIYDEGVQETWSPTSEEFPTWKSYWDLMFSHVPKFMSDRLWKSQVKSLPSELKKLT